MIDRLAPVCGVLLGALLFASDGGAAELKVMATGSMAAPLKEIVTDFSQRTGYTVDVTVGITTTVTATLQAGDKPDLIEVTSFGMDQLDREHLIDPASRVEIARALIGVAAREGAALPDISTPEALARALNGAASIAYVNPRFAGQVGVNLMTFLDRTGVAAEVRKKAILAYTGEEAVQKTANGEADMVVAFISEILPIRGVRWLGHLPAGMQVSTNYSLAIGAGSKEPAVAQALIEAIQSPEGKRVISKAGLEPVP